MKNWYCICGTFVREKRFCKKCGLVRFRIERHPVLACFDMRMGTFSDGLPFNFPLARLSNHVLVTGQTGTGKTRFGTNFAINVENYVKPHRVKLLVLDIEGEWKNIIPHLKEETNYHSVGRNLQINPFDLKDPALIRDLLKQTVFKGIEEEYIDLSAQMNKVLEDAISESRNIKELIDNVKSYEGKKLNSPQKTKIALQTRLDPFTRSPLKEIFMCDNSNPNFDQLEYCNTIIDLHNLDKLVAYKPQVRLIYNVITTYFLRRMLNREPIDHVSNLFVADEAQKLVPKILRKLTTDDSWPATEIATRLRKRGVGLFIQTQRPSNIEKDIVDNCATKISFRLQDQEDIKILSESVGFIDIVEREYMTDKFVNLATRQAIVCTAGHEPFLFTVDDINLENYEPVINAETFAVHEKKVERQNETDDEITFLESIENDPFLSVLERRTKLGWNDKRYGKVIKKLLIKRKIERSKVRIGQGSPKILYQKPGTVPSVRHECYVNWIAEKLSEKGHDVKTNGVGPDIEIPKIKTAIEIELGSSNMHGNMVRNLQEFDLVVVCSDEKKVLKNLSDKTKAQNVLFLPIKKVPDCFEKMQTQNRFLHS